MLNKNNLILAGLTGVSAAAVAVISIGGYFLHRKALKHHIQQLAWQQAMSQVFSELVNGCDEDAEDLEDMDVYSGYHDDEYEHYDYPDDFFDSYDAEDNER